MLSDAPDRARNTAAALLYRNGMVCCRHRSRQRGARVAVLRGVGRRALFVALALLVMCVALASLSSSASAQTACPASSAPANDGGTHAVIGSVATPQCYLDHLATALFTSIGTFSRVSPLLALWSFSRTLMRPRQPAIQPRSPGKMDRGPMFPRRPPPARGLRLVALAPTS